MKTLTKSIAWLAAGTALVTLAMSETARPMRNAAIQHLQGACSQTIVPLPAQPCIEQQRSRLDDIIARALVIGETYDRQQKALDGDLDKLKKKQSRNAALANELRQLRSNSCFDGCSNGVIWRNGRYANAAQLEQQAVLQRESQQIQATLDRLRKMASELTAQIAAVAEMRAKAIGQRMVLQYEATLGAGRDLAADLQATLDRAAAFASDADHRLKEIENPLRLGDDFDVMSQR